ncbi:transposase [Streptomyces sp. NPDC020096]
MASRTIIDQLLALLDALGEPISVLDRQLAAQARGDPRLTALTQLPGIGILTALVIVTEVGDISRFPDARKLAAWAGLTPTVYSSDLTVRHGHISQQGSAWLRWILCEAAQTAKRSPEFAAAYQSIAHRRGKKIATTAIARKLTIAPTTSYAKSIPTTVRSHDDHRRYRRSLAPGRARACACRPSRARSPD